MPSKFLAGLILVVLLASGSIAATPLTLTNLRCEYKTNPIGIDVLKPRMSWEIVPSERGTMQTAYQIRVAASIADLTKKKLVWDSGKQTSDASIQWSTTGRRWRASGFISGKYVLETITDI